MRVIFLSILVLMLSQNAFAETDLSVLMKEVGENFKTIAVGLQSGQLSEETILATEELQRNLGRANLIFPNDATNDSLKLQYSEIMGRVLLKAMELEDVLRVEINQDPQNLAMVLGVFSELNDIRKEGHAIFKTE